MGRQQVADVPPSCNSNRETKGLLLPEQVLMNIKRELIKDSFGELDPLDADLSVLLIMSLKTKEKDCHSEALPRNPAVFFGANASFFDTLPA